MTLKFWVAVLPSGLSAGKAGVLECCADSFQSSNMNPKMVVDRELVAPEQMAYWSQPPVYWDPQSVTFSIADCHLLQLLSKELFQKWCQTERKRHQNATLFYSYNIFEFFAATNILYYFSFSAWIWFCYEFLGAKMAISIFFVFRQNMKITEVQTENCQSVCQRTKNPTSWSSPKVGSSI